jgi:copper oxidase (laccase) domain-containing protein
MACVETPAGLGEIPGIRALFVGRIPGVDARLERGEAMSLLAPLHLQILEREGLGSFPLVTAEQVHGDDVSWIEAPPTASVSGVDGLATSTRGVTLGIHVADCAPVWIVARDGSAGALLHSGRKGTDLGIVTRGVSLLRSRRNLAASDLVMVIGPCIRPPCYEVDFAAKIGRQGEEAGIREIHDSGVCTGCRTDLHYSYRKELGKTGRMLATLTLIP